MYDLIAPIASNSKFPLPDTLLHSRYTSFNNHVDKLGTKCF